MSERSEDYFSYLGVHRDGDKTLESIWTKYCMLVLERKIA